MIHFLFSYFIFFTSTGRVFFLTCSTVYLQHKSEQNTKKCPWDDKNPSHRQKKLNYSDKKLKLIPLSLSSRFFTIFFFLSIEHFSFDSFIVGKCMQKKSSIDFPISMRHTKLVAVYFHFFIVLNLFFIGIKRIDSFYFLFFYCWYGSW